MWFKHQYPYLNFHDMNLNWILNKIREFEGDIKKFEKILLDLFKNVRDEVNKIINKSIKDGTLYVAMEYIAETEELNIILTEDSNNG